MPKPSETLAQSFKDVGGVDKKKLIDLGRIIDSLYAPGMIDTVFAGGGGGPFGMPGTLSVSSVNDPTGNHTHAITSSSAPGAAASLLATDGTGSLTLSRLNIGAAGGAGVGEARASVGFAARVDGSGAGFYAGAVSDVQLYRSAADMWRTPDGLTVDLGLNIGSATGAGVGEARASQGFHARIDGGGGGLFVGIADNASWFHGGNGLMATSNPVLITGNLYAGAGQTLKTTNRAHVFVDEVTAILQASTGATAAAVMTGNAWWDDTNYRRLFARNAASTFRLESDGSFGFYTATDAGDTVDSIITFAKRASVSTFVDSLVDGSGGGFRAGAVSDVLWYRGAANLWRTPGSVTTDIGVNVGAAAGAATGEVRGTRNFNGALVWTITNTTAGTDSWAYIGMVGSASDLSAGVLSASATPSGVLQPTDAFVYASGGVLDLATTAGTINFSTDGITNQAVLSGSQFRLPTTGINAGLLVGGEVQLYHTSGAGTQTGTLIVSVPAGERGAVILKAGSGPGSGSMTLEFDSDGTKAVTIGGFSYVSADGQLQLPTTGSGAGILIGGDFQLYRSAADMGRTPDGFTVDLGLNIGSASGAATGEARASVGFAARVDGSGGGFYAGAASDVLWYRNAADVWRTPDSFVVDAGLNVGSYTSPSTGDIRVSGGLYTGRDADPGDGNVAFNGVLKSFKNSTEYTGYIFVPLTTPLTSTSYDGNDTLTAGSTTTVDTSAAFGAPVGIKAALLRCSAVWTASAANRNLQVRPVGGTTTEGVMRSQVANITNDMSCVVSCNANGDFDIVIGAGENAGSVTVQIWGYWI